MQEAMFLEYCNKSIKPSCTECSCSPPFQSYYLAHFQQTKQLVHFSRREPVYSCPCFLSFCVQVGRDTCREGSLKASSVEELWGWVQCLEQGRHLGAPCFCLCTVVNVFLLSLSRARALFGLRASISMSPTRGCSVLSVRTPLGKEHILLCSWVCSLDVWSCHWQLLNAGSWDGKDA